MNPWILAAVVVFIVGLGAGAVYAFVKRAIARAAAIPSLGPSDPKLCYRCKAEATGTYMGFDYCFMCREVVMMMMPGVSHDPPFGFPGAPGYLDYPKEMETKETKRG